MLEILFEDDFIIAINKPSGLLVHRTSIAAEETVFALQMLRDQIGQHVYPVHRLDRPTSGVLLFSKKEDILPMLKQQFADRSVQKTYLAIVRGIPAIRSALIDHPLTSERSNKLQEAQTHYKVLEEGEIPFDTTGRYPTSRYSLLELKPETGRTHQIRRHLAHIRHYILGDRKHGDNKQNQFFEKQFGMENLLLHARQLEFTHPILKETLIVRAELPGHFQKTITDLGWTALHLKE
ncbi:tRNA pseudouridine65 synthase [Algoriphagus ratkowskyi]|uniref:tRNA pseudouridine synthase C n=1 Tax=Algoriphagus ratkowskyi TaxID=57028 RepID=A0A2W7R6K0_9BACT|nr:pseudouridine synthase [Algoriphagus ratkowskyi]PZX53960.1 tRNA pseudouridine65 synthase [Algoriphagus ratkowskyi]TXD76640.1 pseudouridylate synthase [Algoriphagus ratkowskyi]